MNKFALSLNVIGANEIKEIDDIQFSSCAFVQIEIDGLNLLDQKVFSGTLLNFNEVRRSLQSSGKYLIFTCACGIADDAGWTEIDVIHQQDLVYWEFEYDSDFRFVFNAQQYREAIETCENAIIALPSEFFIEPQSVVFPST